MPPSDGRQEAGHEAEQEAGQEAVPNAVPRAARDPARLAALYQELILDHYRRPRNRGTLERPDARVVVKNPLCGDEIDLQLRFHHGCVAEARFAGRGCSISQSSASMMTELVRGKAVTEVHALALRFAEMLGGSEEAAADERLGELRALSGVGRFPMRVKCAMLPWKALEDGLKAVRR
jgi:nitrogen fixation NifU-like protein